MRYDLLRYLACPYCHTELTCYPPPATAATAADVHVDDGLLVCGACGRWYPIVKRLPEVLSDHLRDAAREQTLFAERRPLLPPAVRDACARFTPGGAAPDHEGAHHKHAEISIENKIDDPHFFGPGYTAPFNASNTEFTLYLLHLFGGVAPLLQAGPGDVVIDSGCGYSWTTEWLHRSGVTAIGVDICRTYLDIALQRIGANPPHLIVGDVEHLPLRSGCARAVLAFESFHHLPNRPRAIQGYDRVLAAGGRVVLAEPGAAHEHAGGSVEVMEKYGILEKGMELADVAGYAAGTAFGDPEQIFYMHAGHRDLTQRVLDVARRESSVEGNLFLLEKGGAQPGAQPGAEAAAIQAAPVPPPDVQFDAHYYANCCGQPYCRNDQWLSFFGGIADRIARDIAPPRVLDAGCAIGLLVETLRQRGIAAEGIDISDYAIRQAHESVRPFVRVGSIAQDLNGRYDLIVCIEVLEHMPRPEAEAAVANFCRHTDDVLFSSSPTDFGEATHLNVQPPEYWAELFGREGFVRDVDYDASFITAWSARFRRRSDPLPRVIRDYERAFARSATERNELRTQVVRFDREVLIAAAETPRLREQLATVNRQLLDTQHQLNQARDQVFHMERSVFWRLREVWVRLRAVFKS